MMDFLSEIYSDYLLKHDLPAVCAEELAASHFGTDHHDWLEKFIVVWDHYQTEYDRNMYGGENNYGYR